MLARLLLGLLLEYLNWVAWELVEESLVVGGALVAVVAAALGTGLSARLALRVWGLTALVWCRHCGGCWMLRSVCQLVW